MAVWRQFPSRSVSDASPPDGGIVIPLDQVIDGPAPEDPAAYRVWRQLRSVFLTRESGSQFDPRLLLPLSGAALVQWQTARRQWLAKEVFASDPRVRV